LTNASWLRACIVCTILSVDHAGLYKLSYLEPTSTSFGRIRRDHIRINQSFM